MCLPAKIKNTFSVGELARATLTLLPASPLKPGAVWMGGCVVGEGGQRDFCGGVVLGLVCL